MGARLSCRPEDVIACCDFGLSDASLRRSSLREEYDTGVADDRRMGSSDGNFAGVIPEHTWGSRVLVCSFDRTGGAAVMNFSKVSC